MTSDDSNALLPGSPAPPTTPVISGLFPYDPISSPDSFQTVDVAATYSPDDRPFETFYLPLLSRAVTYDRAVGYWSAAELQYAAQGTAHFLANGGKMRLIVGAQLAQRDVDAGHRRQSPRRRSGGEAPRRPGTFGRTVRSERASERARVDGCHRPT